MMMEKIPIVDNNDKVLYHKERKDGVSWPEIYRVSALWLTNSKSEILLAQRAFTKKKEPGKWGPAVAGTVEEGETYDANIVKEIGEEIGITGLKLTKSWKRHPTQERPYFVQWYVASLNLPSKDFKIRHEEVEAVEWFSRERLLSEIKTHPEKFLPSMPEYTERFLKTSQK